jgi:hypothetical protein
VKALTIKQPWLWCITDATKRVENRTWKPPFNMIGQRIALHASKSHTKDDWHRAQDACAIKQVPRPGTSQDLVPLGAIVATAVIVGYVVVEEKPNTTPREVEASKNAMHYDHRSDPWFFGPVGWLLDDVRKLTQPIPCKGALGLWTVPDGVMEVTT